MSNTRWLFPVAVILAARAGCGGAIAAPLAGAYVASDGPALWRSPADAPAGPQISPDEEGSCPSGPLGPGAFDGGRTAAEAAVGNCSQLIHRALRAMASRSAPGAGNGHGDRALHHLLGSRPGTPPGSSIHASPLLM